MEYQNEYQFIFRTAVPLEPARSALSRILGIEASHIREYAAISLEDSDATLYYEYEVQAQGWALFLTIHMITRYWEKYLYKNSILDLGAALARELSTELIIAAYDPYPPGANTSDWLLVTPDGAFYRVPEKYPDEDVFDIGPVPPAPLPEKEIMGLKRNSSLTSRSPAVG